MLRASGNFAQQLATTNDTRANSSRVLLAPLVCLLLFGLVAGSAVANTGPQNSSVTSLGPGFPFAIADLDGDHRPDLADVQTGSNISGGANYRIRLQLSSVGEQSIQLHAPAGGLFIEARDVNGDDALDLVLSTAYWRQPVAVFLNDGHGSFSRAEPNAFPVAFTSSTTTWNPTPSQTADAVGVKPQSRSGIGSEAGILSGVRSHADSISPAHSSFLSNSRPIYHAGRAPPFEVLPS